MPLSQQKIVQYGGEKFLNKPFSTMLDLPFFLNAMLQHKGAAPGDFHTHQEFLAAHSGLTPPQLALASQAAFHVYQTRMARTFPIQEFADVASPDVTNRLLSSGILSTSNDTAQFYHHLLHDILASRHFGNLPEEQWNSENLDAISFRASSFDGVSFVFEQLEGERADSFLRHVYDWNPYAAGYALGELDPELSGASMEMETVIFAMLAEKRFDPLLATRRRAADGLLITKSPHAQAYRDATNLQDVFEAVAAVDSNTAWFVAWRGVFTRDAGGTAQDQEINSLHDEDSVIGWTWANVLKRLVLTDAQQQILRQMLDAENQITILWRAAHVLGAFPSLANVVSLDALLSPNQARYVRYGAIRSLAEIAYRSPTEEIRNAVVDAIKERSSDLMMDEFVMGELKRALQITPGLQPESWITIVTQIAREFYLLSEEPMRRDSWRKYLADTESIYKNVPLQA
jgi:hypothetical protein